MLNSHVSIFFLGMELQDLMFITLPFRPALYHSFYHYFFPLDSAFLHYSIICWTYLTFFFLLLQGLKAKNSLWVSKDTFDLNFSTVLQLLRLWQLLEMEYILCNKVSMKNLGASSAMLWFRSDMSRSLMFLGMFNHGDSMHICCSAEFIADILVEGS